MKKNGSKFLNNRLDKYYTKPDIATDLTRRLHELLLERSLDQNFDQVIEPSAGNGSFLDTLHEFGKPTIALDLFPEHPLIVEANFLLYRNDTKSLYLGNPPFGHASNLAIQFFNHAVQNGAEIIAFVLPRTFRKASVQNRLDHRFHIILDHSLPKNAFLFDGQQHDVPSVFQVWKRCNKERARSSRSSSRWIQFTTPGQADHAIRRVGRRAGDLLSGTDHGPSSTLFFKVADSRVLEILEGNQSLKVMGDNTAAVRSVCKSEIYAIVDEEMRTGNFRALSSPS